MVDLHSLPESTWPENAIRNNGPDNLVLERAKLRELAEGWPCYRYVSSFLSFFEALWLTLSVILVNGRTSNRSFTKMPMCILLGPAAFTIRISWRPRKRAWTKVPSSCTAVTE